MRQTSCNIGRQAGKQTEDNRQTGRHVTIIHMQAYADRQASRRVTSRQRQWNRLGVSTGGRSPVDNINGNGCACQLGGGASWARHTHSFVNWDLRVDWEVRVNWELRAYSELRSPRGCSSSWSPTRLGSWLRGWVNLFYVALQTVGQTFLSL